MMSHRGQDTLMMSTVARGGQIKRTYNLAFDEIESESSAKRARLTIPCQAEGSGLALASCYLEERGRSGG